MKEWTAVEQMDHIDHVRWRHAPSMMGVWSWLGTSWKVDDGGCERCSVKAFMRLTEAVMTVEQ
jgi:hypothetical protein